MYGRCPWSVEVREDRPAEKRYDEFGKEDKLNHKSVGSATDE